MDDEEAIGCTATRKKLDDDLKSGAEKIVIDEDVLNLKKCLNEPEVKE